MGASGDLDEKMDPDVQPLKNALQNYLLSEDRKFSKDLENLRKFGTGKKSAAKGSKVVRHLLVKLIAERQKNGARAPE